MPETDTGLEYSVVSQPADRMAAELNQLAKQGWKPIMMITQKQAKQKVLVALLERLRPES